MVPAGEPQRTAAMIGLVIAGSALMWLSMSLGLLALWLAVWAVARWVVSPPANRDRPKARHQHR
jgi:hypothetical protein